MKRNTPTRIVEVGRVARGSSGQPLGWLQNLNDRARNMYAQLVGLQERINSPLRDGFPSCVSGERTFLADTTTTLTIPEFPTTPDVQDGSGFITLTVNPIILAGETYRVPVTFTPPGVFFAHNLVVGIEAGLPVFANQNVPFINSLGDYRQIRPITPNATDATQTGGFVDADINGKQIQYVYTRQVLGNFCTVLPFLPFLWNIIDEKSGRQYAQDWMPSGALLNTRGEASTFRVQHVDSDLFEFDTPWPFERDAQVAFLFRPIMDLYQVAAGDAQQPYRNFSDFAAVSDQTGGRRVSQATVRVEFHGNHYYTSQDVLKDGARVTDYPDPSQANRPQRRNP